MYLPMPWLKINRLFAAAVCFAVFSVLFSSRTMAAPPTVRSAMQLKPTNSRDIRGEKKKIYKRKRKMEIKIRYAERS